MGLASTAFALALALAPSTVPARVAFSQDAARPGDRLRAAVVLEVPEGQALDGAEGRFRVILHTGQALTVAGERMPRGTALRGRVVALYDLVAAEGLPTEGTRPVVATLSYRLLDAAGGLVEEVVGLDLSAPLRLAPRGAEVRSLEGDLFPAGAALPAAPAALVDEAGRWIPSEARLEVEAGGKVETFRIECTDTGVSVQWMASGTDVPLIRRGRLTREDYLGCWGVILGGDIWTLRHRLSRSPAPGPLWRISVRLGDRTHGYEVHPETGAPEGEEDRHRAVAEAIRAAVRRHVE
ncbi:MAG: hypothetical protein HY722_17420 [Planctomycetes bacterium]|nr:hypothetical protein [Planctomycetota bacterium]